MCVAMLTSGTAGAFDHSYVAYSALLSAHVRWTAQGHASTVDYAGLKGQGAARAGIQAEFSAVGNPEFERWSREQQMAFLINAYNFFTLQLVLTRYPDLTSIKRLGSLLRSPWKTEFFDLLGSRRHLDWIEHDMLRPRYRDERVHFAVNCASIGCPALRPEAFLSEQLGAQLGDQEIRFLGDRARNRFNGAEGSLNLSPIFQWYGHDFDAAADSLKQWLSARAGALAETDADRERIRRGAFTIAFLDYDWFLNDLKRGTR